MLKSLLFSYVVTGMLLALLTVLLYKFELDEQLVSAAIVAIYVLATMAGGLVIDVYKRQVIWKPWGMISTAKCSMKRSNI